MTETAGLSILELRNSKTRDSIGYPAPNVQVKIADVDTGVALGPNLSGEICLKLPVSMLGYYKNPEETKKTLDSEGT